MTEKRDPAEGDSNPRTGLRQRKASEQTEPVKKDAPEGNKYAPKEVNRIQKLIHGAKDSAPPALQPYIEKLEPVLAWIIWALSKIIPIYLMVLEKLEEYSKIIPSDIMMAIIGFIVCFFGGMFPTVIAAVEAWNIAGGAHAQECLRTAYDEFKKVRAANAVDDQKDDDGDGIADVDQIDAQALVKRKIHMFMTSVQPKTLNDAVAGIYTGWVGVIATLKLQFAKVIALGASIGKLIKKPAEIVLVPVLSRVLPEDYHPWIEVFIGVMCKSIAISFAWMIQRIISAFHSAIRGGLMFSRGILRWANKQGYVKLHQDDSMLDEYAGWAMAALGFYTQFKLRFSLPWILSIVLWPFTVAEWYIVWTISE